MEPTLFLPATLKRLRVPDKVASIRARWGDGPVYAALLNGIVKSAAAEAGVSEQAVRAALSAQVVAADGR